MEELVNVEHLKMWGLELLLGHSLKFDRNKENSYRDILMGLNILESDPVGCTVIHGELCFTQQKNQTKSHLLNLKLLDGLKRLVFEERGVRDSHMLRKLLIECFPRFKDDIQHDAGDAYLSIIECLPDLSSVCSLKIRKTRTCNDCGTIEIRDDTEEWCMMLKYQENIVKPLQVSVDEWCNSTSQFFYECACKYESLTSYPENNVELYYAEHTETREIIGTPQVLHVKVKDRYRRKDLIIMSDTLFLNGVEYELVSEMLYTWSGEGGHWGCIVKKENIFIIWL